MVVQILVPVIKRESGNIGLVVAKMVLKKLYVLENLNVDLIAVEAGMTLLLGKDEVFRLCQEVKVSLIALA